MNESLVTVNLSMYCYRLWVVPPFRSSPSCESKKLALKKREKKKMRARRRELLEWGTNINLFFTEFFDLRDGLRRKRETARSLVLLSPVTLNKMLCLVLNVHTGLNSLCSLKSNLKEQKPIFYKSSSLKRWPNANQYDIRYVLFIFSVTRQNHSPDFSPLKCLNVSVSVF